MLSGERTMTLVEPGKSVYAGIGNLIEGDAVMDASLLVGFTWADESRSHAAALAFGLDEDAVWRAARQLAQAYWDSRHDFDFGTATGSVADCIDTALRSAVSPVFISDSGDNVTAGAAGDVPYVLEKLLAKSVSKAVYASLADAAAVEACFAAGADAVVDLSLGGKLDPVHGRPLPVRGRVDKLHVAARRGRQVILRVDEIDVIITERRLAFTSLAHFDELGINPLDYEIVCLKLGYLFPDFQRIAPLALMALSPGGGIGLARDIALPSYSAPDVPL